MLFAPHGRLILTVLGGLAEFEKKRNVGKENQRRRSTLSGRVSRRGTPRAGAEEPMTEHLQKSM
jgi:hypothetical protein